MSTHAADDPRNRTHVRLRLTRRGRAVVTAAIATVILVLVLVAAFLLSPPQASAGAVESIPSTTVTVSEGESLWSIARQHTPEGVDVRDYILLIQEINDLDSSLVQPGQRIAMPLG